MVLLYGPDLPQTGDPPVSASQVLGLQAHTSMAKEVVFGSTGVEVRALHLLGRHYTA
jgi:hypothetical protein